ncbi:G5 domain-containing protein [Staphylococcus hominis]|uniref:G5 domain-containing protein n=1 Tax=Staphylococcus hominis TaxID=1290 RepID=UPI003DA008B8
MMQLSEIVHGWATDGIIIGCLKFLGISIVSLGVPLGITTTIQNIVGKRKTGNSNTNYQIDNNDSEIETETEKLERKVYDQLNAIVVVGDNTIYRKYELMDIDKTIQEKNLMWKYDNKIEVSKLVDDKPLSVDDKPFLYTKSVSFTTENDASYKPIKTITHQQEIELIDEETNHMPQTFIKHIFQDDGKEYRLDTEKGIIFDNCQSEPLSDEQRHYISKMIGKIYYDEKMREEELQIIEWQQQYGNQNHRDLATDSLKSAVSKYQHYETKLEETNKKINDYREKINSVINGMYERKNNDTDKGLVTNSNNQPLLTNDLHQSKELNNITHSEDDFEFDAKDMYEKIEENLNAQRELQSVKQSHDEITNRQNSNSFDENRVKRQIETQRKKMESEFSLFWSTVDEKFDKVDKTFEEKEKEIDDLFKKLWSPLDETYDQALEEKEKNIEKKREERKRQIEQKREERKRQIEQKREEKRKRQLDLQKIEEEKRQQQLDKKVKSMYKEKTTNRNLNKNVVEETNIVEEAIPFDTIVRSTNSLPNGVKRIIQEGTIGLKRTKTIRVINKSNNNISETVTTEIVKKPSTKLIEKGN